MPRPPHRAANGDIDNAVMVLHWTGSSSASLLTEEYIASLFSDGAPLDARRYYLIFPDNFGHGESTKPSDGLGSRFPHYFYGDLVNLQHKLITESRMLERTPTTSCTPSKPLRTMIQNLVCRRSGPRSTHSIFGR